MALTVALVERTPNRLRYLVTSDGGAGAAPDVTGITNRLAGGVAGSDLNVDSLVVNGSPIQQLVSTPVATTAAARTLFGDGLTAVTDIDTPRGHISVRNRNSFAIVLATASLWSADAVEGSTIDPASAGRVAIVISGPNVANAACYVDLVFQHTYDR
jgi:hypothetical protein